MAALLSEIDWSIIFTLILVSALVAWIGDIIGMKLGKKRITVFNLRPKYTTRIIAVLTGIGIAFVTLFVSAMASESVRTAIFNMKYVRSQIVTLTSELKTNKDNLSAMEYKLFQSHGALRKKQDELNSVQVELDAGTRKLDEADKKLQELENNRLQLVAARDKAAVEQKQLTKKIGGLKKDVESLHSEADSLKTNMQHLREGRIAAFSGEILAQGIIASSKQLSNQQITSAVDRLSEECITMLAERFGVPRSAISSPSVNQDSVERAKAKLKGTNGRYLIRMSALSNAVAGEPVATEVSTYSTKLIYKKGELLNSVKFSGSATRSEVELKISDALKEVNKKAVHDGVLRDPISGTVGSVESSELSSVIKKIVDNQIQCTLEMRALRDVYTEGPVTLKLSIKQTDNF